MRSSFGFTPKGLTQLILFYLFMVFIVILANVLIIGGAVWLVVTILQSMGVI